MVDLKMPHLDVEKQTREMRRMRSNTPIILMSGYNHQEIGARFAGRGISGFEAKPLRPYMLITGVKKALHKKNQPEALNLRFR